MKTFNEPDFSYNIHEGILSRLGARKEKYLQWIKNLSGKNIQDVDKVQFIFLFKKLISKLNNILDDIEKDKIRFHKEIQNNKNYEIIFDKLIELHTFSEKIYSKLNEVRSLSMLKALASGKIDTLILNYLKEIKIAVNSFEEDLKKLNIDKSVILKKLKNEKVNRIFEIISFLIKKYEALQPSKPKNIDQTTTDKKENDKNAQSADKTSIATPSTTTSSTTTPSSTTTATTTTVSTSTKPFKAEKELDEKSLLNLGKALLEALKIVGNIDKKFIDKIAGSYRRSGYGCRTLFPNEPKIYVENSDGTKSLLLLRHVFNKDHSHVIQYVVLGSRDENQPESWENLLLFYASYFLDKDLNVIKEIDVMDVIKKTSPKNYEIITKTLKSMNMSSLPSNLNKSVSNAMLEIIARFGEGIERGERIIKKAKKDIELMNKQQEENPEDSEQ